MADPTPAAAKPAESAKPAAKPDRRRPAYFVGGGVMLFSAERLLLGRLESGSQGVHLDGTLLSILALAPVVLVVIGVVLFMMQRMRRR